MKLENIYTLTSKAKWFGDGPWCAEPDLVEFEHEGFKCRIIRVVTPENDVHVFGGYLCGYVQIPQTHPWHDECFDDINCDCHGGVTFAGELEGFEENSFWVGFDCAHSGDVVPSVDQLYKILPSLSDKMKEQKERIMQFGSGCFSLFNKFYKSINFCINECKKIAEQAKEAASSEATIPQIDIVCSKCGVRIVHECAR